MQHIGCIYMPYYRAILAKRCNAPEIVWPKWSDGCMAITSSLYNVHYYYGNYVTLYCTVVACWVCHYFILYSTMASVSLYIVQYQFHSIQVNFNSNNGVELNWLNNSRSHRSHYLPHYSVVWLCLYQHLLLCF